MLIIGLFMVEEAESSAQPRPLMVTPPKDSPMDAISCSSSLCHQKRSGKARSLLAAGASSALVAVIAGGTSTPTASTHTSYSDRARRSKSRAIGRVASFFGTFSSVRSLRNYYNSL